MTCFAWIVLVGVAGLIRTTDTHEGHTGDGTLEDGRSLVLREGTSPRRNSAPSRKNANSQRRSADGVLIRSRTAWQDPPPATEETRETASTGEEGKKEEVPRPAGVGDKCKCWKSGGYPYTRARYIFGKWNWGKAKWNFGKDLIESLDIECGVSCGRNGGKCTERYRPKWEVSSEKGYNEYEVDCDRKRTKSKVFGFLWKSWGCSCLPEEVGTNAVNQMNFNNPRGMY